jgi:hypothetical protein
MITVHEKMHREHQVRIAADPFGFGGRKAPSSMGKISTAEVLRLRSSRTILWEN